MPVSDPFQPDFSNLPESNPEAAATDFFELFRPDDLLNPVGAFATLQEAVDAAQSRDIINVLAGAPGGETVSVSPDSPNSVLTITANAPYTAALVLSGAPFSLSLDGDASFTTTGSFLSDAIQGNAGDDTLEGRNGADFLSGGAGNDLIGGDAGPDTLSGAAGDDRLFGGAGDDILYGGPGNDYFNGGTGIDRLALRGAADSIAVNLNYTTPQMVSPLQGIDRFDSIEEVIAGQGDDTIVGNDSDNYIVAWEGNDQLYGGAGDDTLGGVIGGDLIEGGAGDDFMDGGRGPNDTLSYYGAAGGVIVNLGYQGTARVVGGGMGVDTFFRFENLYGSRYFDDTLVGDADDNILVGFGGHDALYGAPGDDTLYGMRGADTLVGGGGADSLGGGGGYDVFQFNATGESDAGGHDTILDFDPGTDLIQLSGIDADTTQAGDQAFAFIGSAGFSNTAGELRFTTDGTNSRVTGDVDGDGSADLQILLLGITSMSAADFIL